MIEIPKMERIFGMRSAYKKIESVNISNHIFVSVKKGANKVWGGLPKDGRVENLELRGDLSASTNYIKDLKQAMHEIGGMLQGFINE